MANKLNFKPDEWTTLLESTMVAGIAVSAAQPSGVWGTLKEFLANNAALEAVKRDPHSNELVWAVIADLDTEQGKTKLQKALHTRFAEAKEPADFMAGSLACLKQTAAILDEREPIDAAAFKQWLFSVGQRVAEAASEGGFFGFGGTKVSEAERAALHNIALALDIVPARPAGTAAQGSPKL